MSPRCEHDTVPDIANAVAEPRCHVLQVTIGVPDAFKQLGLLTSERRRNNQRYIAHAGIPQLLTQQITGRVSRLDAQDQLPRPRLCGFSASFTCGFNRSAQHRLEWNMPSSACGISPLYPHSTPECRPHSSALHVKACIAKQILHLCRADQIATASELMVSLAAGYECVKFFPAGPSGGVAALEALAAPFPSARFCPTGGITQDSLSSYLRLPAVLCVGGSWVTPSEALAAREWGRIEALAAAAATARTMSAQRPESPA